MRLESLGDLLAYEVKVLRGAERQLAAALGRLSLQADSSELFLVLQTEAGRCFGRGHSLKEVAAALGRKCSPRSCDPLLGMAEEARVAISKSRPGADAVDGVLMLLLVRALAYLEGVYADCSSLAAAGAAEPAVALLTQCHELVVQSTVDCRLLVTSMVGERHPNAGPLHR